MALHDYEVWQVSIEVSEQLGWQTVTPFAMLVSPLNEALALLSCCLRVLNQEAEAQGSQNRLKAPKRI